MPISQLCSSKNSISHVLSIMSFVIIHVAWHTRSLLIFLLPCMFNTESILGMSHIWIWRGNTWLILAFPSYGSVKQGLAATASISSMYTCSNQTWFSLGILPCIPNDIIFHLRLTGISSMKWEISFLRMSVFVIFVENNSHPTDTSASIWIMASQSPNLVSLNQLLCSFMILSKGILHLSNSIVYTLPPLYLGLAWGKYTNQSLTSVGKSSSSSRMCRRLANVPYFERYVGIQWISNLPLSSLWGNHPACWT